MFRINFKQIRMCTKKYIGMALMVCIVLVCLAGRVITPAAYAATDASEGCFTVAQSFKYNGTTVSPPAKTALTYKLTPITAQAPMPEGCDSDGYIFELEGACEQSLLPIEYDTPGVFVYELGCITQEVPDCEIDKRVYTIEEHVTDDLQHNTIIYIEKGEKLEAVSFAHMFLSDPGEPEDPKDPNRPGPGGNNNEKPNRPQPPSNQGKSSVKSAVHSSPKTGDFGNPAFWIMAVAMSGTLMLLIIFAERRSKGKQKK